LIIELDANLLFQTFKVSCFEQLEQEAQIIAPSMVEYYLDDLSSAVNESTYINKSNIQKTIYLDQYSVYLDYGDTIYLEIKEKENDYETESLW